MINPYEQNISNVSLPSDLYKFQKQLASASTNQQTQLHGEIARPIQLQTKGARSLGSKLATKTQEAES